MRLVSRRWGYKWYKIKTMYDYVRHCRILGLTHQDIAKRLRVRKEKVVSLDISRPDSYYY